MCVLAPTSTRLPEILCHLSTVECTCHRHANALCRLATRLQSGPKRWPWSASQPASHRRRPLEVAIFIIDGTDKYQRTEHALTNPLVCRSCSEVACGLCRPLACLMAWAHRKVEFRGGGEGSTEQRDIDGTSTEHRRNNDGTTTEQKLNANGQMGLCIEGEGQGQPGTRRGPGGGGAGEGPAHTPGHSRNQAWPQAKHTFSSNCKTRDLNDQPFRRQSKTLTARPHQGSGLRRRVGNAKTKTVDLYRNRCFSPGPYDLAI